MNNKKIIIETGYYHPSNVNWSYHIHMIIDKTGARMWRSTFGSDKIVAREMNMQKMGAGRGSMVEYKWKDIKDLLDIGFYNGINWGEGSIQK